MKLQNTSYCIQKTNFTSMKKSQFDGVDYAVVEKFKPPIEKFDTNDDLQNWAGGKCKEIINTDFGGRSFSAYNQRESGIRFWAYNLEQNNDFIPTEQFLIMNGITKHLKPNDNTFLPSYNHDVLNNTMNNLKAELEKDKTFDFNFGEIYRANLKKYYTPDIDTTKCQWVVIPSKNNDRENFQDNVERLRELSSPHWCTKSTHADVYLSEGDIHIYLEHGKPKIAIIMDGDAVSSFYDELNNKCINKKYFDEINAYIKDNDMFLLNPAKKELNNPIG